MTPNTRQIRAILDEAVMRTRMADARGTVDTVTIYAHSGEARQRSNERNPTSLGSDPARLAGTVADVRFTTHAVVGVVAALDAEHERAVQHLTQEFNESLNFQRAQAEAARQMEQTWCIRTAQLERALANLRDVGLFTAEDVDRHAEAMGEETVNVLRVVLAEKEKR